MVTRLGDLLTYLLIIALIFSCENITDRIEEFSHFNIRHKFIIIHTEERWNNFNGNGYRLIIMRPLNKCYFEEIKIKAKNINYQDYCKDKYNHLNISDCVRNTKGLCKEQWDKNEIRSIIVDTINEVLIYYHVIL